MIRDRGLVWLVWRPIIYGITTYHEVMEVHDLSSLLDANSALDVKLEMDKLTAILAREQGSKGDKDPWH